jgi:4-amino-4-deoxy-L-arabinose transferase-like glycosyltransferase
VDEETRKDPVLPFRPFCLDNNCYTAYFNELNIYGAVLGGWGINAVRNIFCNIRTCVTLRRLLFGVILLSFMARLFVVAYPGRELATPWSGGSDMPAYVALAHSVVEGRGLSYSGMPSAFRPPLYPLFLALNLRLFGNSFPVAVRALQFLAGILTALVCWLAARNLWSEESALVALAAAIALPTLIFFTGELLTECLATLIVSTFLFLITRPAVAAKQNAVLVGAVIGIGTLTRFNLAVLGVAFFLAMVCRAGIKRSIVPTLLAGLTSLLIVSPWITRNLVRFGSGVLLSSQTGYNLVQGVLTPDGRTQAGESEELQKSEGWVVQQLETNSPSRLTLPDEGTLNRRAESHAASLWSQRYTQAPSLILQKLGYFWLGTDQAFETRSLSNRARVVRFCGTFLYWLALVLAALGWFKLRISQPAIAATFLVFAVIVTVFHLPFVMNTRLATPFLAPLVCILCPGPADTPLGIRSHLPRLLSL